jgi:hypothetical protein
MYVHPYIMIYHHYSYAWRSAVERRHVDILADGHVRLGDMGVKVICVETAHAHKVVRMPGSSAHEPQALREA